MKRDAWHYPRTQLARQVLGMFSSGLSTSLVFFAPRRMGKTEFLRKDIQPLAEKEGWQTFYFSFLEVGQNAEDLFTAALTEFLQRGNVKKIAKGLKRVKKISGKVKGIEGSIELDNEKDTNLTIKTIVERFSMQGKTLLLLDEIQALAQHKGNTRFVAALRTALDMYKDEIKVIFTGSSQAGLRRMFSEKSAPFFHFGQNLPFPKLGKEFTDHLAQIFHKVTQQKIDPELLWKAFQSLDQVPQLIRALVERLVLHPGMTIKECTEEIKAEISLNRSYVKIFEECTPLQQLLLFAIASKAKTIFSMEHAEKLADQLGAESISISAIQSAMRSLIKKELVVNIPERGGYDIDDPNFNRWLKQKRSEGELAL